MKKSTESTKTWQGISQRYSLITRADFETLRKKPNLTLDEKRKVLCGAIRFDCETEYPSFTADEIYALECRHFGIYSGGLLRVKLAGKILLIIDVNIMNVTTNRNWTHSLPPDFNFTPGYEDSRYYAIANLNTDSGLYEIQEILKNGPAIRREIIKKMPPRKIELTIYEKMEEEIAKRINQRILGCITPEYSLKHSAKTILGITSWDS